MPSQKTALKTDAKPVEEKPKAPKKIKCQVLKAIGVDADAETVKYLEERARRKGLAFTDKGLTTMIHPNKKVYDKQLKEWVPGEPVYVELDVKTAQRLADNNAVKINLQDILDAQN